ncbi:cytidine deaminase [Sporolactobacillus putidus]|uniref:Cytidine deaminase n=1 Tax=Sporolactobacillus putidus TaxID=492735 RepID=A0A917VYJ1_9BACL|nr:cytidine deaminase [Sporolactobacillus putidus]GGL40252.1 cytidine deaminase [Sporolactobacillus putidus]
MEDKQLIETAQEAMKNAYVPYSHYHVGAALLTKSGKVFTGFNIENAAFSVCNCAERTAIFKAFSEGEREYAALAVISGGERPVPPCGACRQVMSELCPPEMRVILANTAGLTMVTSVNELLPGAFEAGDMKK